MDMAALAPLSESEYAFWSDEDRDEDDDLMVCPVIGHGYHNV